jgi:hypothetical protein
MNNRSLLISLALLAGANLPSGIAETPAPPNPFGVWAYMGAMPTLAQTPHVRGKLVRAAWAELEPEPGVWQWDAREGNPRRAARKNRASVEEAPSRLGLDGQLREAAKANLQIILVVFAGSHAPSWIYDQGVPKVKTSGVRGVQSDTYPYYLNDTYQRLFRNMVVKVREHVEQLPANVRQHLLAVQAGFSSTGDFGPYHGTLVEPRYEISDEQWLEFYQRNALFYQQQYQDARPRIRLLFNPSNAPDRAAELIDWLKIKCPHSIIKAGNTGHMYQINGERQQMQVLRAQLFARADDDFLRARSEFGEESRTGGWLEAPAWNMYSLLQAALYTGLDINCIERGDAILADKQYFPAYEFFNRYAGLKNPATCPGAWCALRDGLDAADADRFPEDPFGPARPSNRERFLRIAERFAANGARQGDPEGGMRVGIRSRALEALNDVGWEIYRGNYEHFLEQIEPAATSVGHWRIGPKDQPYGRYARGFEHATGKDALFFRFDPRFLTSGADRRAEVRVVYFDRGSGRWTLRYHASDGTMKQAAEVQKKNTGRWQEIIVPIDDASFGGQGPRGCDLQLKNPDTEDDIFHLVEVRRR